MACPFMTTMKLLMVLAIVVFSIWKLFYQRYLLSKQQPKPKPNVADQKTIVVGEEETSKASKGDGLRT